MLPRPISFSGLRSSLPRGCPASQASRSNYHYSGNSGLLLPEPYVYIANDHEHVSNRRPPGAHLRSTCTTNASIIKNYSARRFFASTASCSALSRAKSGPGKLSRSKKSVLGAPKTPTKAQPKPVVDDTAPAFQVYDSFARLALDPDAEDELEDAGSSNAAVGEDVSAEVSAEASIASPKKEIRKEKKEVTRTVKPKPIVAKKAEPVSTRPDKKASPSTPDRTLTVGPARPTSNIDSSTCLALVPVSGITEESPAVDPWTREFQSLVSKVDASKSQLDSFRRSINSVHSQLKKRRFEHFKEGLEHDLSCVAERRLHKQAISLRCQQILSGLSSIAMDLRGLHRDTGDPMYAEYAEKLVQNLEDCRITSHEWRALLMLRLQAYGSLSTNFDASWIYHQHQLLAQVAKSYFDGVISMSVILRDLRNQGESGAIINSDTIFYTKNLIGSYEDILNDGAELRKVLGQKALHQFFLSKPKNDIHWQQLDFWAPFQLYLGSSYATKSAIGFFFNNDLDERLSFALYNKVWKGRLIPLSETSDRSETTLAEIGILCQELFEINWVRLKLQQSTAGNPLQKKPRNGAAFILRKPLSASPGRFERWVNQASQTGFKPKVYRGGKSVPKKSGSAPKRTRRLSKPERSSFPQANTKSQAEPKATSASYSALLSRPRLASSEFPSYRGRMAGKVLDIASRKPEEIDSEKTKPSVSQRPKSRKAPTPKLSRKKPGRRSPKRSSRTQPTRSS